MASEGCIFSRHIVVPENEKFGCGSVHYIYITHPGFRIAKMLQAI